MCRDAYETAYNNAAPWRWLYTSVSAANARNEERNNGALSIAGMRAKWDGRCYWCHRALEGNGTDRRLHPRGATIDHVQPTSRGGRNEDSNAVWACWTCNMSKRGQTVEEWLHAIALVLENHCQPQTMFSTAPLPDGWPPYCEAE